MPTFFCSICKFYTNIINIMAGFISNYECPICLIIIKKGEAAFINCPSQHLYCLSCLKNHAEIIGVLLDINIIEVPLNSELEINYNTTQESPNEIYNYSDFDYDDDYYDNHHNLTIPPIYRGGYEYYNNTYYDHSDHEFENYELEYHNDNSNNEFDNHYDNSNNEFDNHYDNSNNEFDNHNDNSNNEYYNDNSNNEFDNHNDNSNNEYYNDESNYEYYNDESNYEYYNDESNYEFDNYNDESNYEFENRLHTPLSYENYIDTYGELDNDGYIEYRLDLNSNDEYINYELNLSKIKNRINKEIICHQNKINEFTYLINWYINKLNNFKLMTYNNLNNYNRINLFELSAPVGISNCYSTFYKFGLPIAGKNEYIIFENSICKYCDKPAKSWIYINYYYNNNNNIIWIKSCQPPIIK